MEKRESAFRRETPRRLLPSYVGFVINEMKCGVWAMRRYSLPEPILTAERTRDRFWLSMNEW
jgi:hypothetical protein